MAFKCVRCGSDGPQLARKPLGGQLGERVLRSVCQACWTEWDATQLKIINEYRLNLAVPQHFDMLVDEMLNFLNLKSGATGGRSVQLDDAPNSGT
jgi:Fe-S cluster biosynthesis and repair protein YggX